MPSNGTIWARVAHGYRSPTLLGPCSDCGKDKADEIHRIGQDEIDRRRAAAAALPGSEA